jgi:uracil-DNA glycosylase family protein
VNHVGDGYRSHEESDVTAQRKTSPIEDPLVAAGSLRSLSGLRTAVARCHGCDLWETATQAVAGDGPAKTDLMLVGEQPGDQEDRQGHPFVGPAGRVLDDALEQAGIDRSRVYVSNVVKHFAWKPRGKRRIHRPPTADEINACHPWLEAELRLVRPDVLVCLGASAARSVLGRPTTISKVRGAPVDTALDATVFVTVHPSSILRTDPPDREEVMRGLVADLHRAAAALS